MVDYLYLLAECAYVISIPLNNAINYENTLIKAVEVANKNRKVLAPYAFRKKV